MVSQNGGLLLSWREIKNKAMVIVNEANEMANKAKIKMGFTCVACSPMS